MSRVRQEAGFSLVELLVATSLMLIVMTATTAIFARMEHGAHDSQTLDDTQLHARVAVDSLDRRLRNLANPDTTPVTVSGTTQVQEPLLRAQPQDLIFTTVRSDGTGAAGSIELYRYCLSSTDGKLYSQRLTGTSGVPAAPTDTACPGTGWPTTDRAVVAEHVVNGTRPVFRYQVSPSPGTYTEQDSVNPADFPTGIAIRTQLWLDLDPTRAPAETRLTSRVFLRNQNRPPVPDLDVTVSGRTVVLNASGSEDPEGLPLSYRFVDSPVAVPAGTTTCTVASNQTCGWGTSATYTFKPSAATHTLYVQVRDAGGLTVDSIHRTVTCTTTTCTLS